MIAECIKVYYQPSMSSFCKRVKSKGQDQISNSESLSNLGSSSGLFSRNTGLILIAKISKEMVLIPIDHQFRKKFRKPCNIYNTLNAERMAKIMETMPRQIEVKKDGNSYRVTDPGIDEWFSKI